MDIVVSLTYVTAIEKNHIVVDGTCMRWFRFYLANDNVCVCVCTYSPDTHHYSPCPFFMSCNDANCNDDIGFYNIKILCLEFTEIKAELNINRSLN